MDNFNYPMGADNQYAPWNQSDPDPCPRCESDEVSMECDAFRCMDCGHEWEYEESDHDPEDYM